MTGETMTEKYPVKKITMPKGLKGQENGKVDSHLLKKASNGAVMYFRATAQLNKMIEAATKDKITLKNIGDYRPYERQLALFYARFDDKNTGRVPKVTRRFQRKTWFLRKQMSPVAVPGTSNHGWGLAIDIDTQNPRVFNWLCNNAPKYGFYLQGKPTTITGKPNPEYEPWHWQYCLGDK